MSSVDTLCIAPKMISANMFPFATNLIFIPVVIPAVILGWMSASLMNISLIRTVFTAFSSASGRRWILRFFCRSNQAQTIGISTPSQFKLTKTVDFELQPNVELTFQQRQKAKLLKSKIA